jgi:hypothetical protein
LARRARSKAAQLVGAGVNLVGFQNLVDDHGQPSLAKPEHLELTSLIRVCCCNIALAPIDRELWNLTAILIAGQSGWP